MLEFKLGCYKSYPLTGISSRDSGLDSKEIRIWLEGCYNYYPLTGISSRDSGLASKEKQRWD